jgi:hypothetical protein
VLGQSRHLHFKGLPSLYLVGRCMIGSKVPARTRLLAESWSAIALQYETRLAPLFQPWLDQLVVAIGAEQLPEGPIIVPACGPGVSIASRDTGNSVLIHSRCNDARLILQASSCSCWPRHFQGNGKLLALILPKGWWILPMNG